MMKMRLCTMMTKTSLDFQALRVYEGKRGRKPIHFRRKAMTLEAGLGQTPQAWDLTWEAADKEQIVQTSQRSAVYPCIHPRGKAREKFFDLSIKRY